MIGNEQSMPMIAPSASGPDTNPPPLVSRRLLLKAAGFIVMLSVLPMTADPARAQAAAGAGTERSAMFIRTAGDRLVDVVNGPGTFAQKRVRLQQIIDSTVDVDSIARFCLGRFWNAATPEQRREYTTLFHEVLLNNIAGKLGEYRGVKIVVVKAQSREDTDLVNTTVERPDNPPAAVDWVISSASGSPRIVDVVAEGTSLRLTQRQDYMSYLVHNGSSVDKLIEAMRQQAAQSAQNG